MKKILDINSLSILIAGVVLTFIAVFNSFMYVGLIEDGAYRFFEGLTKKNFLLGVGGFSEFPFNLRYFSSIWSHFPVGFCVNVLEMHNIKYLLYIFTFVSYFKFLVILAVIYLNLPRNKKQFFEMILLSFLLTFAFTSYQAWAENIITGLFIWVLFVIFYYVDFDKLTVFNEFCIVIFSFMLISSHQMVLVFIPVLLVIAIKKQISIINLEKSSEIALIISYVFLLISILFNFCGVLDLFDVASAYSGQRYKYLSIIPLFHDPAFVLVCSFVAVVLLVSFFKNSKKYDDIKYIITLFFIYFILKLLIFEIPTSSKFANITLGFHIPLFFFVLIICADLFKIKMKHKYIRLINLTLCLVIYLNSIHYGLFWKLYLTNINQHIINNKKITVAYFSQRMPAYPILDANKENEIEVIFPEPYETVHSNYILYILIFMEGLFGKYNFDNFIKIKTSEGYICKDPKYPTTFFVIKRKNALQKFGIKIDSMVRVNGNTLLE